MVPESCRLQKGSVNGRTGVHYGTGRWPSTTCVCREGNLRALSSTMESQILMHLIRCSLIRTYIMKLVYPKIGKLVVGLTISCNAD
jgi:hypothetical protein